MLIGYARVSTTDQNPELQIDELQETGCEQIYQDKISGSTRDRPELTACLKTLRKGDTLIIWRLDRLARSLRDLIEIVEELKARGVGVRSLHDPIDTTSATGNLVFQIFGALSEFERRLVQERVNAGLKAARKRGRIGGRPPKLTKDQVRQARILIDGGESLSSIANHFDVDRTTLYRNLKK